MGSRYIFLCLKKAGFQVGTLPETNMAPEKKSWKRRFLLETIIFRCYVSFRECIPLVLYFTPVTESQGLGEFETNQNHLRDGGGGIPPVIRNRFDIFNQWDKVQQKTDIWAETNTLVLCCIIGDYATQLQGDYNKPL